MKTSIRFITLTILLTISSASFAAQPAARIGDRTSGGGAIVRGSSTVLINNQPAARLGDAIVTPRVVGLVPCVGGPIITGSNTVLINNKPAAGLGDLASTVCGPETIVQGSANVIH